MLKVAHPNTWRALFHRYGARLAERGFIRKDLGTAPTEYATSTPAPLEDRARLSVLGLQLIEIAQNCTLNWRCLPTQDVLPAEPRSFQPCAIALAHSEKLQAVPISRFFCSVSFFWVGDLPVNMRNA